MLTAYSVQSIYLEHIPRIKSLDSRDFTLEEMPRTVCRHPTLPTKPTLPTILPLDTPYILLYLLIYLLIYLLLSPQSPPDS